MSEEKEPMKGVRQLSPEARDIICVDADSRIGQIYRILQHVYARQSVMEEMVSAFIAAFETTLVPSVREAYTEKLGEFDRWVDVWRTDAARLPDDFDEILERFGPMKLRKRPWWKRIALRIWCVR